MDFILQRPWDIYIFGTWHYQGINQPWKFECNAGGGGTTYNFLSFFSSFLSLFPGRGIRKLNKLHNVELDAFHSFWAVDYYISILIKTQEEEKISSPSTYTQQ